mmetsp:Transcript_23843/g.93771  ORF Transcript_23843/g.93771 Transcript_23843/m.93771 type:complete len:585 (-) Transcript_23843:886-2640(-)
MTALTDRKVFTSFRFGGSATSSLKKVATENGAILVKDVGSADLAIFPSLDDVDDLELAKAPASALVTTHDVVVEAVENDLELPASGFLRFNCLRDCLISTTGMSKVGSSEVAKIVRELGGKFSRNFSSGTTHLIAEVAASEKHRAAIRTMKQVVSREWIEKCWTTGRRAEEKEFPAKPLAGLVVSATGLSFKERAAVEKLCVKLGASFMATLTRGASHLIAGAPNGPKYDFAVRNHIRVLRPKWLYACEAKGSFVDESEFEINEPNLHQEISALFLDSCYVFLAEVTPIEERYLLRKLRAGGATRSPRLTEQTSHVVVGAQFNPSEEALERYREVAKYGTRFVMSQWLESCLSAKMNVPVDGFEVELVRHEKTQDSGKRQRRPTHVMDDMVPTSDIFRGLRIGVQHEEDAALVVRGGGKVIRYDSDSLAFDGVPTHVVLDHGSQKLAAQGTCVSRKWLSSCLMVNSLLPVDSNRLYSPITSKLPIAKMDQMNITVSGFYMKTPDGFPLRGSLAALIRLLGAKFSERMARKSTTQLICESASGDKYARARDWGIPCLSVDWLYSCADHGQIVETLPFIVRTETSG